MFVMSKRFVGCICRWLRRTFNNLCKIDASKDTRELANYLIPSITEEDKKEQRTQRLLNGARGYARKKAIEHFEHLSVEIDPLENTIDIPPDSVKSIKANISNSSDGKKITFEDNRANRKKRH